MGNFETNADGLGWVYGTVGANDNSAGAQIVGGEVEQLVIPITDATTISASPGDGSVHPAPLELNFGAVIPANSLIKSVLIYVDAAFTAAGAGVLDIGTYGLTDNLADDDDGLGLEAVAQLTADTVVDADATGSPALITKAVTVATRVGVTVTTGPFTAGSGRVVIEYVRQH